MSNWQDAGESAAVASDAVTAVMAGTVKVIAIAVDGVICAYRDVCPHEKFPLSIWGELEDGTIICGKHFWEFDARTGRHISRIERPNCDLTPVPTRVEDGRLLIDVDATID